MIKKLLFVFLLLVNTLYGYFDQRLEAYPETREWLKDADTNGESAYNIGVIYHQKIKDYDKAIEWYKKAYNMDDEESAGSAASNLGNIYDDKKNYTSAENWYKNAVKKNDIVANFNLGLLYKKAYKMGNIAAATSLGYLNSVILGHQEEGIKWYKVSAKHGNPKAINNLNKTYYEQGDLVTSTAYTLAMANYGYTKEQVFEFLKNTRKIDDETIKKAYQLQQTLDIPKHYTGGID